jgi:DNA repair protein RadC
MSAVHVIRDAETPRLVCPSCGSQIDLSVVGTRWKVRHPSDVGDQMALQLRDLPREELHVLLLDTKCVVIGQVRVYQGNVSASVVRIAELFRDAVHQHASGVLLLHNHPSGDPSASPEDLHLTAEASAAGRLLQIPVLDHLIVARDQYVSLRAQGFAFDDLREARR